MSLLDKTTKAIVKLCAFCLEPKDIYESAIYLYPQHQIAYKVMDFEPCRKCKIRMRRLARKHKMTVIEVQSEDYPLPTKIQVADKATGKIEEERKIDYSNTQIMDLGLNYTDDQFYEKVKRAAELEAKLKGAKNESR